MKPERAFPSKREFVKTHTKQLNIIARAIGTPFIIIALLFIIIPAIIDLPMALTGGYVTSYCQTADDDFVREGIMLKRDVHFIMQDGQELGLRIFSSGYRKGEKYEVHYLPHMKIGCMHRI